MSCRHRRNLGEPGLPSELGQFPNRLSRNDIIGAVGSDERKDCQCLQYRSTENRATPNSSAGPGNFTSASESQETIAEELGITQQTVSRTLNSEQNTALASSTPKSSSHAPPFRSPS